MGEDFSIRALGAGEAGAIQGNSGLIKQTGAKVTAGQNFRLSRSAEDDLVAFISGDDKKEILKNPRIVFANRDNLSTKKTEKTKETDKTDKPEEKGTLDNPRVVQETKKQSEEQQARIQSLVDNIVRNSNFGRKDMEVTDNVIYKDEDGNPTRQVITKENSRGEVIKIQVEFDEKGRITHISNQLDAKDSANHKYKDGDQYSFEYLSDGTIRVRPADAYRDQESGITMQWATYNASYIIDTDGKIYMIDARGQKSEVPFILPF